MLPARQNIFSRRVIIDLNDMSYVFCGCSIESTCHLFVMCEFSLQVCYSLLRYVRIGVYYDSRFVKFVSGFWNP